MLEHGGRLRAAAKQFNIPLNDWLDLSAAINPSPYDVGHVPAHIWQCLPEENDGLEAHASDFYGGKSMLATAGSQAAIQALPLLQPFRPRNGPLRVGLFQPSYNEHYHAWQQAGCEIVVLAMDSIETVVNSLDVMVIVNPNNPTGELIPPETLLVWHRSLASRGGYLIVDEAFIDVTPEYSIVHCADQPGLVVLRSLGKFFGLAGARVGFVFSQQSMLDLLKEHLGPWTVSNPSRYAAIQAFQNRLWQDNQRLLLADASKKLSAMLTQHGLEPSGHTDLFQWVETPAARRWHYHLATQGILVRLYDSPPSIRLGLPANECQWQKLSDALDYARLQVNAE